MKILTGKIVSMKNSKTLLVEVFRQRIHPIYKKIIKRSRKYKVHYEDGNFNIGDTIKIIETRPVSKDKHYKVMTSEKGKRTVMEKKK